MTGVSVIGCCTGLRCGARVIGANVGTTVGGNDKVGLIVTEVGLGDTDGIADGRLLGAALGFADGDTLSVTAGFGDGGTVGSGVGESDVGGLVGLSLAGRIVGRSVGATIGLEVGRTTGALVVGSVKGVGVTSIVSD